MKMNNEQDKPLTRDELRSVLKAIDRPGFEKHMDDYIKEISDPNNTREYNQFLKQAEEQKDLPANVKLAQPSAGFCIKSEKFAIKRPAIRQKVFINIVAFDGVNKPFEDPVKPGMWSLPYLLNKGRHDQDSKGKLCTTYDVVFHPEAIDKSNKNTAFKKFVADTSIAGINNNILKATEEKISNDYTFKTKINYKGAEVAMINVHSLSAGEFDDKKEPSQLHKTKLQKEVDKLKSEDKEIEEESDSIFDKPDIEAKEIRQHSPIETNEAKGPIKPSVKIKYSDSFELHKYFYSPSGVDENAPQYRNVIIEIKIPLMDSINSAELQIDKKRLEFKYKNIYDLSYDLPVEVDNEKVQAKFDRHNSTLTITAEIIRKKVEMPKSLKEDDNIEYIKEEDYNEKEKSNQMKEKVKHFDKEQEKKDDSLRNETQSNLNTKVTTTTKESHQEELKQTSPCNKLELEEKTKSSSGIKLQPTAEEEEKSNTPKPLIEEVRQTKEADEDDYVETKEKLPIQKQITKSENKSNIVYLNFNCEWIYEID